MTYRLRGIEALQHGRRILVGVIAAKDLARMYETKILKIDVYSPSNPDGYQRSLSKTRSRKFGRYVQDNKDGIAPTGILIYSRDSGKNIKQVEPGVFQLPDSPNDSELYVTDGQHRTDGFSEAYKEGWLSENTSYDVPVTILFWNPESKYQDQRLEEATQFYTINTQQKRMRTDLAHQYLFKQHEADQGPIGENTRLGLRPKKKDYIPYEIFISKKLRTEQDSPWKDLILPPNATGDAPITEGSFTDSLAPMMDYASKTNLTMRELIFLLKNFWSAVFKLCPQAKVTPQDYVLMKTSGVYSLHLFLPILLMRKPNLKSVASQNQFEQVLQTIGDCFTNEFWESKNGEAAQFGTGKKSFQELAEHIITEMP